METFICRTCGGQYQESETPPERCLVCEDERQYLGSDGQLWTTPEQLRSGRRNEIREIEPGLFGICTEPKFAIGQRALLIRSPHGNVLWDCISMLDDETVSRVNDLGGVSSIAISHPHFYSSMVDWANAFDATIHLNELDRDWVVRPDDRITYWSGQLDLQPDVRLIRAGGHFPGSSVCLWTEGADGRGALLTGDTIYPVSDRRWVSFMHSFPNLIPLSAVKVREIAGSVRSLEFDRVHGGWWGSCVETGARDVIMKSADRYILAIS